MGLSEGLQSTGAMPLKLSLSALLGNPSLCTTKGYKMYIAGLHKQGWWLVRPAWETASREWEPCQNAYADRYAWCIYLFRLDVMSTCGPALNAIVELSTAFIPAPIPLTRESPFLVLFFCISFKFLMHIQAYILPTWNHTILFCNLLFFTLIIRLTVPSVGMEKPFSFLLTVT